MKNLIYLFLIILISCSCKNTAPVPFDLSNITFKEKIADLIKPTGLKLKDDRAANLSFANYGVFESSDSSMLKFNGVNLAGKQGDSVNRAIIHYELSDSTIRLVELKVFSKPQIKALETALDQKLGKAPFPDDAYTTVFSPQVDYYRRVWVDPKTTIGHFFTNAVNKEQQEEARMAILNYSDELVSELARLKGYASSISSYASDATEIVLKRNRK
ncbi:hypothetical protein [Pedobacter caeni]|uniref:DUF4369 domain-containing protein n=1 Tax=Pedobacter caeni TaxID=288992 RepID=A0A1M5AJF9_9SPHI|nr:hypothetical protein [Pedobacter caeni]SHF30408.1 hypothetical protein SAMN04488522_102771 [Pedobacter caeni]